MSRFGRIRSEFSPRVMLRMALILAGYFGMALLDYFALESFRAGVIAAVGLAAGFVLRRPIPEDFDHYQGIIPKGLFVCGIALTVGSLLGLSKSGRLAVIKAVTAVIFNLPFWSLSDTSVINTRRKAV